MRTSSTNMIRFYPKKDTGVLAFSLWRNLPTRMEDLFSTRPLCMWKAQAPVL
jgi:hypothetical protein